MYGFLVRNGEKYYTNFTKVFLKVPELYTEYNWLLSDIECNVDCMSQCEAIEENCYWLEGEKLFHLLINHEIQWIWGVFSGFPKEIPLSNIQMKDIPYANGNLNIWKKPISIQHPLAEIELIAWDSTLAIFFGKSKALIDKIQSMYPFSELL